MKVLLSYKFLYIVALCLYTDFVGFGDARATGCLMFIIAAGCFIAILADIMMAFTEYTERELEDKWKEGKG